MHLLKRLLRKINKEIQALCIFLKFINNHFIKILYFISRRFNRIDCFISIYNKYSIKIDNIDNFLFRKLSKKNQKLFIRWLLKRYYGVNTATKKELDVINAAFDKVIEIYPDWDEGNGYKQICLNFDYLNSSVVYNTLDMQKDRYKNHNADEKNLMRYYEIAHAFFLTEYVMDGFNPQNGQTIFDCGAAHGDTMLVFKYLYPDSYVYSFESDESNCKMITLNIKDNNIKNVTCENNFLYSKTGTFFMDKKTFKISETATLDSEKIETLSLDDYVDNNKIENIGLIKFDIEGGEQEALKGCIKTIKSQKPLLYIPIYHLQSDIYAIPEFLVSLNLPMKFRLKWTEKKVWGMDCVLFVRFE